MKTRMIRLHEITIEIIRDEYKNLQFIPSFPERKDTFISDAELVTSMTRYIFQDDYFIFYENHKDKLKRK